MAPPLLKPSPFFSTEHHRRCSKAQMCFFNILHIISVFPKPTVTDDLNTTTETLPFDYENCNDRRKTESELATEHSEISHVEDQSSGIDFNVLGIEIEEEEEEDIPRDEGYLGLLIEAAQLILGGDSSGNKTETARGGAKKKRQCWTAATEAEWYAEFEDTSPVVRSKRGRSQVLPFRYRDSVVEPLVRWSSTCRSIAKPALYSKRSSK
ncbi:hypothetical protein QVD17_36513 [Tagetes erecta]|uniref:Uncharacterized protein n=1 Tax=Tagetes erecta TaxID=13708 RepID=A0AAD8NIA1_TARER|nr:hypothetical protein QVD17_36513 [Tagetes erecta]